MKRDKLLNILLSPRLTEKASRKTGQYVFKVASTASKTEIKAAVEQLFQVNVTAVNVLRVKGATASRMSRVVGKHAPWKKAYVMLAPGQLIQIG